MQAPHPGNETRFATAATAMALILAVALTTTCTENGPDRARRDVSEAAVEPHAGLDGGGDTAAATAFGEAKPTLPEAASPRRDEITLIAAGDVSFGRLRGQLLLQEPERNDFEPLSELLEGADIRFVNLESQLSDQGGQTVSPINKLVFVGPPTGAGALKTAGIDIVSLANNHAWDYGREALLDTLSHLDARGVAYAGAGRDREAAYSPQIVERDGFRVAFVAVTDIWNQGLLRHHAGREHVADADRKALLKMVREARSLDGVAAVVVSYHGGYEYVDTPHEGTRELLRAAVRAGADVVLGHHPHVLQRVEMVQGRPVFYSLGNLLMRMTTGKPWTEWGALARLTLTRTGPPRAEICPYRIFGLRPVPLADDPNRRRHEAFFRFRFERLLRVAELVDPGSEATLGEFGDDGCAPLRPR